MRRRRRAHLPRAATRAPRSHTGAAAYGATHAPRVRIAGGGRLLLAERIPLHPRGRDGYTARVEASLVNWLLVRDLDGDDEPEVALLLTWGGTYCCYWSRVYRFVAGRYIASVHWWGDNQARPRLRDLNGDRRPQLVSVDSRFAALTSHAYVFNPIQIWSYASGRFTDVTRRYPRRIEGNARRLWRYYATHRRNRTARYVLAAWAADQYLLGRPRIAERGLQFALRRGDLNQGVGGPHDPRAYLRSLKRFLRNTGYIR